MIGLSPVDQNDIDIEKEKGIESEEEAMIAAAKTFFYRGYEYSHQYS